jgi:hypothetical protein
LKTNDKKEHIRKKLEPIWSELKKTRSDIPRKKLKESFILEKSKDFWHGTEGALSKCEIRPARAPVEEPFIQPSTAGTEKEAHKKAVALACALKKCSPSFNQVYAVVVTQNGNNRELIVSSNDKANGPVRAPENSNAPKKCEDFKNLATNMKDGEHGLEFMLDDLTVRFVKPNADNLDERYHEHDAEQRALRWIHEQRKTHKDGRVVEMIMPTIPACQYCRGAIRETYGGGLDDSKLKVVLRDPKKECL